MKKIINLYKPVGMTPLQAIEKFKAKNPGYVGKKMSYAGRLDPMAEGVLLVLVDDENKRMREYMGFDKEYRAEILFGFSSDSNDVLGIAEKGIEGIEINVKDLKKKIKNLRGSYDQKIPKYSSYKIKGKPMFYYARKGIKTDEIRKKVFVKAVKINSVYEIGNNKLLKYILRKVDKVEGDFRQGEIKGKWGELLEEDGRFIVVDLTISSSSGTYIRAIADDLGGEFGGGLLLSLKRLKVGKVDIGKSLRLKKI